MKCPSCHAEFEAAARFCGVCGSRLPAAAAGSEKVPWMRAPPDSTSGRAYPRAGGVAPVPAAPARDRYLGAVLNNRFRVDAKLGEGGFGSVYRGTQLGIGRPVALKLLHPDLSQDPNLVARFRREGEVMCRLRDAHTITTYDFDRTGDGTLFIAMELLEGRSLHEVLHREAPVRWQRLLKILCEMCSSLMEAHSQGIVHRDLKPENIYLEHRAGDPEFVKILDFGIAKVMSGDGASQSVPQLTATGQTLGTLEYMSPEQLMGKPLDGRSDLYALGVLSHELLTRQLPFPDAVSPAALIAAQLKRTPPPPSSVPSGAATPAAVDAIVLRLLEKEREARFGDADELRRACETLLESDRASSQVTALPRGSGEQLRVGPPAPVAGEPPSDHAPAVHPPGAPGAVAAPPPSGASRPPPSGASRPPPSGASRPPPTIGEGIRATSGPTLWPWIVLGMALAIAAVVAAFVLNR